MEIFKLAQTAVKGWDTYSDCVVIAENAEQARRMHPRGGWIGQEYNDGSDWPIEADDITAEHLGTADALYELPQVMCASFHAG